MNRRLLLIIVVVLLFISVVGVFAAALTLTPESNSTRPYTIYENGYRFAYCENIDSATKTGYNCWIRNTGIVAEEYHMSEYQSWSK